MHYLPSLSNLIEKATAYGEVSEFYSDVSARISTVILNILTEELSKFPQHIYENITLVHKIAKD